MKIISIGDTGKSVENIQIILAGFRGTVPDGIFGFATATQISVFQKEYMQMALPTGIVHDRTWSAIKDFAHNYKVDFEKLKCPCGECDGFGNKLYHNKYRDGKAKLEKYYLYEYPGMHIMLIWSYMGLRFLSSTIGSYLAPSLDIFPTSGYRCSIRNKQTLRTSTNHHGKAIDSDFNRSKLHEAKNANYKELIALDKKMCNKIRGIAVEKSNAQIGWYGKNRKSLESKFLAPTWVHMDLRRYAQKYLQDRFFVKSMDDVMNHVGL